MEGLSCAIPEGTVFEMPDEWEADGSSARVNVEWLRAQRQLLFDLDGLAQQHGDAERRAASKRWLRLELRLLRSGDPSVGYEIVDLDRIRANACRMHRGGLIAGDEFWDFLEVIERAEDRLRQIARNAAQARS
jgi:hypothetical protein